jgi:hypothetical protein
VAVTRSKSDVAIANADSMMTFLQNRHLAHPPWDSSCVEQLDGKMTRQPSQNGPRIDSPIHSICRAHEAIVVTEIG